MVGGIIIYIPPIPQLIAVSNPTLIASSFAYSGNSTEKKHVWATGNRPLCDNVGEVGVCEILCEKISYDSEYVFKVTFRQ